MHTSIDCIVRGTTPIMFHNSQLADPANVYAIGIKALGKATTPKKAQEIYDLSWEGCLYLDERRRVIVPGENIEAAIVEASAATKQKKNFKAGLLCEGAWPLIHDGPADLDQLKADPRFRDLRSVKTKRGDRVMFCRPKFVDWSLAFTLLVDADILDPKKVTDVLRHAGMYCAVGCYRPKYGRFVVESAEVVAPKVRARKSA